MLGHVHKLFSDALLHLHNSLYLYQLQFIWHSSPRGVNFILALIH